MSAYHIAERTNWLIRPPERRHCLDVIRMGKHVDRLDLLDRIATVAQDAEIAGERRGVARHVYQPLGMALDQRLGNLRCAADSRRIDYQSGGSRIRQLTQRMFYFRGDEADVV